MIGTLRGAQVTCSPLSEPTPIHIEERSVSLDTISNLFYGDPSMSYVQLPDHDLHKPVLSYNCIKTGILLL